MANPSSQAQLKSSFFHSVNKTMVLDTSDSYESVYGAGHVNKSADILSDELPWFNLETQVDQWIIDNPGILYKYTLYPLTELPGTNGQSWYVNDSLVWRKPFILNSVISDDANTPAYGYIFKLYRDDNTRIGEGSGRWWVDPYQGIVKFDTGFTPADQGYGVPKVSCYVYIGNRLSDTLNDLNDRLDSLELSASDHTHEEVNGHRITINDGSIPSQIKSFDMWVEVE